jgi:hypothetical protein
MAFLLETYAVLTSLLRVAFRYKASYFPSAAVGSCPSARRRSEDGEMAYRMLLISVGSPVCFVSCRHQSPTWPRL